MTSSIEQKISRCIQALNVESLHRLQTNMNVIEGYIQRKPIFLEWLHGQLNVMTMVYRVGFQIDILQPTQILSGFGS